MTSDRAPEADSGASEATGGAPFDAVILTGGRGRRLGGRDKAALEVAGTSMLQRALTACDGAERVIVAGGGGVPDSVHQVQENPPGGGPVAGIVAALPLVRSAWLLVLAVDQPDAERAVSGLLAAPLADSAVSADSGPADLSRNGTPAASWPEAVPGEPHADPPAADPSAGSGLAENFHENVAEHAEACAAVADLYCHMDADGYPQWLLGLYRADSLQAAAARVGTGHGVSVRSLTADLTISPVADGAAHIGDVDTWADHARWEARLRRPR